MHGSKYSTHAIDALDGTRYSDTSFVHGKIHGGITVAEEMARLLRA
jgi:hypothetical protein